MMGEGSGSVFLSDGLTWDQVDNYAKSIGENRSSLTVKLYKKEILGKSFRDNIVDYLFMMNMLAVLLLFILTLHMFGVI